MLQWYGGAISKRSNSTEYRSGEYDRHKSCNTSGAHIEWASVLCPSQESLLSLRRSEIYGSDRFRPSKGMPDLFVCDREANSDLVVRSVEEAAAENTGFDYVFVCVKALPDVYDLSEVIQPVITPSHTCIIINTTSSIGIEASLMKAYPRNMVLSLCSGIELTQIGPADFEHTLSKAVHVGAVRENPALPLEAQQDMIESLTLTLEAGAVECVSTVNIEKHQWERLIGMIAFHPISVILQEPNHTKLMEDPRIKELIDSVFDECLNVAEARRCSFSYDYKLRAISAQTALKEVKSTMYQDYLARRPLEIEVYLSTPIRLAQEREVPVPHLKSIYALLQHINKVNQTVPASPVPGPSAKLQPQYTGQSMMPAQRPQRPMLDGRSMSMVQGPPSTNGGYIRGPPPTRRINQQPRLSRQDSLEGLEEFASVAMYTDLVPSDEYNHGNSNGRAPQSPHYGQMQPYNDARVSRPQALRSSTTQGHYSSNHRGYEQQPSAARQGGFAGLGNKMSKLRMSGGNRGRNKDFDEDEDDDFIEPPAPRGPPINPDQVDMLAMTRRGRNSAMGTRLDAERTASFATARPRYPQSRTSSQNVMNDIPNVHDTVTASALFGMGDNRYGTVDSRSLAKQANIVRLNSMQSERLASMTNSAYHQNGYGGRPVGPPITMNGRNYASSGMSYRGGPQYNNPSAAAPYRAPAVPQNHGSRQQLMPQPAAYPAKVSGQNLGDPGVTRSVTGSASASFGSLGNGSGSHSSSSSRDEIPPPPLAK